MRSTVLPRTSGDADAAAQPKRRSLLLGAGAAGAALVAAKIVPVAHTDIASAAAQVADDGSAGYRLSPHVIRYYETARV